MKYEKVKLDTNNRKHIASFKAADLLALDLMNGPAKLFHIKIIVVILNNLELLI